jgi:RNA polymerase sigma-70 factor (ECF subfamily)
MLSRSEPSHDDPRAEAAFAEELAGLRTALRGYVLSILPHHAACDDVVQETALFLWERRGEYDGGTNVKAWAFKVAWFKAMAWRRDKQREKTVNFSEDTLHEIAGAAETLADEARERLLALRDCLSRLSPAEVRLLQIKYVEGGSLSGHAREIALKPSRVQKTISRLRLALRRCIETKLSRE